MTAAILYLGSDFIAQIIAIFVTRFRPPESTRTPQKLSVSNAARKPSRLSLDFWRFIKMGKFN
jgi:hypothetical protein